MAQMGQSSESSAAANPVSCTSEAAPSGTYRVIMPSDDVREKSESSEGSQELPGAVIGHGNLVCRGREL